MARASRCRRRGWRWKTCQKNLGCPLERVLARGGGDWDDSVLAFRGKCWERLCWQGGHQKRITLRPELTAVPCPGEVLLAEALRTLQSMKQRPILGEDPMGSQDALGAWQPGHQWEHLRDHRNKRTRDGEGHYQMTPGSHPMRMAKHQCT